MTACDREGRRGIQGVSESSSPQPMIPIQSRLVSRSLLSGTTPSRCSRMAIPDRRRDTERDRTPIRRRGRDEAER